ncbi:Aste57867_14690 [Aphanomyces stellatus]|uniref:Aste57867_14690 protein n=1 Tax=Aphanomyces stellatus TaxID=120398 RepID=A0A485L1C1_9STRA|nr:hypothetical protein As57867_014635 [Aphanomyces stellatus]VFT91508.1 Aste57867_14690 [Aphanomyces stellatus]
MDVVVSEENAERKCEWRVTVDGIILTQNFFGGAENATGGALWDSSLVLWQILEDREDLDFRGKRVLELGSGVGFLAMKLAKGGAHVVATDGDNDAMYLLKDNLKRNNIADGIAAATLPWGSPEAYARFRTVHSEPFEYIVGADLIYNSDFHGELLHTLRDVCSESTVVLLSYRIRDEDKEEEFVERLQPHFNVITMWQVDSTGIVFLELTRRNAN